MAQAGIKVQAPEDEALREAFEQHYVPLLKLCIALSGQRDVGEDIVQEAFVRSAARIPTLPARDVLPYLRRVALNLCLNLWRNRLRRRAIEARLRPTGGVSAQSPSPYVDERTVVWQALSHLPERQRACVVLRYYEDLSERETAVLLRCSVGTVKSQTSRALAKLRRDLRDES